MFVHVFESNNGKTEVPAKFDNVHKHALATAQKWSLSGEYLDTDRIRQIDYGNLVLRKRGHLYLTHGVVVAVMLLAGFWLVSMNWDSLVSWVGFFEQEEKPERIYTVVTSVTQLPPPPLIEKPKIAPPKTAPAKVEKPPNVGKIKKVKKEEAPPEQTLATQKEIKEAIQQQGGVEGGIGDGPVFMPVERMPAFLRQRKPKYPEAARRAGIEGKVFVSVLISEKGKPIKAQIMKREPVDKTVFDKAAIRAVMKSTYSPGIQDGKPVKVWLMIPIRFTLR